MTAQPDAVSAADNPISEIRDWLAAHRADVVAQLSEWVRVPSVAGADEHEADLTTSARWLADELGFVGFPRVEIWSVEDGPPAVFAEWPGPPGAPTVLVYSHHDVRKAVADQWHVTAPFVPLVDGNRLYGRGASDAKGQVLTHLWGVRAYLSTLDETGPPLTLKLLVEGEEETGSPHLAELLQRKADRVRADLVVLSDTMTWAADRPAVCTGNRGMMKGRLEIRAADVDAHSGAVAGAMPNPVGELVRVLSRLHDDDGRVTVPGFYDDVVEPSFAERAALAQLTADTGGWGARSGSRGVRVETGRSLGETLYTRPAVEVLMLTSGDPELPTSGTQPATASAEIQVSLVPDQQPDDVTARLERWFADEVSTDFAHRFEVATTVNQPPYLTPPDHPVIDVLASAMSDAWGRPVGRMRNAGGAPTQLLADATDAPVAFFGIGLPEDRWHGPDESVDLDVLLKGAATMALFWPRLAQALARHEA